LVVAALLFIGFVVWGSVGRVEAQCEVCVEFNGQTKCTKASGETAEAAQHAAQISACGPISNGMSESIACQNTPPKMVQCSAR
jgi:hypothetical protein